jgi:hypothetical protein
MKTQARDTFEKLVIRRTADEALAEKKLKDHRKVVWKSARKPARS